MAALSQLYPQIPDDLELALEGLAWFFSRGDSGTGKETDKARTAEPHRPGPLIMIRTQI